LLTPDQSEGLADALDRVGDAIADGSFVFERTDEDVHMAIERGVAELLGEEGARLHAGRSRNDLVVTDLRMWLLDAADSLLGRLDELVRVLIGRAREHASSVMPGSTHNRPAQPVTLGSYMMAHAFAFLRDSERLVQWRARTSVSPLGAGALATSTLGLDPITTAQELGFAETFSNSIDAVSDRDFVVEFLSVAANLGVHVSRLAADLARWSEPALGWARIDDAYATGSSMMPQKRNPDVAELSRGKTGRISGDLVAVVTVLSGLPLGYHRDLQEDKEPVFDAADTLSVVLPALTGCVDTVAFDTDAMREAAMASDLYATDIAEALVASGIPFREAHRRVGELLRALDADGRDVRDMDGSEWEAFGLPYGARSLDPDRSVQARDGHGGPSPDSVLAQAEAAERAIRGRAG
jgi:argininosuccinate lyase